MSKEELINKLGTLHWYCVRWLSRENEPVYVDIFEAFDGEALYESLNKYNSVTSYDELYRWVRGCLRGKYHFKAEHEMLVRGVRHDTEPVKIDVWEQIAPNIIIIVDYLNEQLGLNFRKSEDLKQEKTSIIYQEK